jgi:hypothetical protein
LIRSAVIAALLLSGCAQRPLDLDDARRSRDVEQRRGGTVAVDGASIASRAHAAAVRTRVVWTRQPAPGGARHGLDVQLVYSGAYLLFIDARDEAGAPLVAHSIERRTRRCGDHALLPNCEFVERLHVELPAALVSRASLDGLSLTLESALGTEHRIRLPAYYVAGVLGDL